MCQLLRYLETVFREEFQHQLKKSDIVIVDNKLEILNIMKISVNIESDYFFIESNESVYYSININGVISIMRRLLL